MIIDGHVHLGGCFKDIDNLISSMESANIKKSIVVPFMFDKTIIEYYRVAPWMAENFLVRKFISRVIRSGRVRKMYVLRPDNTLTLELTKKFPGKFLRYFWVNPRFNEDIKEMKKLIKKGEFIGIKLHQVIHPFDIFSENVIDILSFADRYRLPVFIHVDTNKDFKKLMSIARGKGNASFIIAHMDYVTDNARAVKEMSNIYIDISPVYSYKIKKIKNLINYLGIEKFLFGTDSPSPVNQLTAVNKIKNMELSNEICEKIFFRNYFYIFSRIKLPLGIT